MLDFIKNHTTVDEESWLNSSCPQDTCPYCGEDELINYESEDGEIYVVTCRNCKRTWGQRFTLTFMYNFKWE